MMPRDDENFSTLLPSELTPAPTPVQKPAAAKPKPPPPKSPEVTILSSDSVAEICSRISLNDRAKQAATMRSPLEFFDALVRLELFEDAIRVLAHTLPLRQAIGWACLSARQAHPSPAAAPIEAALAAVGEWVRNPSDEQRLTAGKAAEKAGLQTPAGRACVAVFLAGTGHDLPEPLRKRFKNMPAIGVTAALFAAAVWQGAEKKNDQFAWLLAEGRKIACGARPWESS